VYYKLLNKVEKLNESGERAIVRTWSRASVIVPEFIGHNFEVHNGKKWYPLYVTEEHVGHRLGEFAPTRQFRSHMKDERKAKR
jgi:small subunit ribosomal protein S19